MLGNARRRSAGGIQYPYLLVQEDFPGTTAIIGSDPSTVNVGGDPWDGFSYNAQTSTSVANNFNRNNGLSSISANFIESVITRDQGFVDVHVSAYFNYANFGGGSIAALILRSNWTSFGQAGRDLLTFKYNIFDNFATLDELENDSILQQVPFFGIAKNTNVYMEAAVVGGSVKYRLYAADALGNLGSLLVNGQTTLLSVNQSQMRHGFSSRRWSSSAIVPNMKSPAKIWAIQEFPW